MNLETKIAEVTKIRRATLRLLESVDFGDATEPLDRAADQLEYALDELREVKRSGQNALEAPIEEEL